MDGKKETIEILETLDKVTDEFLDAKDFIESTKKEICLRDQVTVE